MINYLITFFVTYLIGSLPTAYLVVKATSNIDIRTAGSGNVGGRNALDVTGKKWVGTVVVLIDVIKGIGAIVAAKILFAQGATVIAIAMSGVVIGHCYPIWLKFHGGRGLATAAGAFLILSLLWIVLWLALYFLFERITKNVNVASALALIASPIVMWILPENIFSFLTPSEFSNDQFFSAATMVIAVCLTRHMEPLQKFSAQHVQDE